EHVAGEVVGAGVPHGLFPDEPARSAVGGGRRDGVTRDQVVLRAVLQVDTGDLTSQAPNFTGTEDGAADNGVTGTGNEDGISASTIEVATDDLSSRAVLESNTLGVVGGSTDEVTGINELRAGLVQDAHRGAEDGTARASEELEVTANDLVLVTGHHVNADTGTGRSHGLIEEAADNPVVVPEGTSCHPSQEESGVPAGNEVDVVEPSGNGTCTVDASGLPFGALLQAVAVNGQVSDRDPGVSRGHPEEVGVSPALELKDRAPAGTQDAVTLPSRQGDLPCQEDARGNIDSGASIHSVLDRCLYRSRVVRLSLAHCSLGHEVEEPLTACRTSPASRGRELAQGDLAVRSQSSEATGHTSLCLDLAYRVALGSVRVRSIEVLGESGRGVDRSQSHTAGSEVDVEQIHSVRTVKVLEHALRVRNEFLNRVTRSV